MENNEVEVIANDAVTHGPYRLARGDKALMSEALAKDLEKAGLVSRGGKQMDREQFIQTRQEIQSARLQGRHDAELERARRENRPAVDPDTGEAYQLEGAKAAFMDAARGVRGDSNQTADRNAGPLSDNANVLDTENVDAEAMRLSDSRADANLKAKGPAANKAKPANANKK